MNKDKKRNEMNRQWKYETLSLAQLSFYGPVKQSQEVTRQHGKLNILIDK